MKLTLIFLLILLAVLVAARLFAGFHTQKPVHYATTSPAFDLATHLGGDLLSEGVIYGPLGRVSARFTAKMRGDWTDTGGTLTEDFKYAESGQSQQRKWTLTLGEGGLFTATAPDVIGTAQGQVSGSTVRLTYKIQLTETAGGHVLDVVDWMYLMENGVIINRSEMRKYGLKVAELVATIRPAGGP